jgi:hypothetical protein
MGWAMSSNRQINGGNSYRLKKKPMAFLSRQYEIKNANAQNPQDFVQFQFPSEITIPPNFTAERAANAEAL